MSIDLIKMITQNLRFLDLDIKEVQIEHRKSAHSRQKECFNNSFKYMLHHGDHRHKYVLGYLLFDGHIPIEHAWVKEDNKYYDVTLKPKDKDIYVSVAEFTFTQVSEYVDEHQSAPSLYDMNRFLAGKKGE